MTWFNPAMYIEKSISHKGMEYLIQTGDEMVKVQSAPALRFGFRGSGRFGKPVVKPKDTRGTIRRIWQYLGEQSSGLTIAIALIPLTSLLGLFGPYYIG